jgi:uncharacterized membrane protein YgaE (UPF0421/DUF939 family)
MIGAMRAITTPLPPLPPPVVSRVDALRAAAMPILQCAIAAGVAWFVAHNLIGHVTPFFAPISATIALGLAPGRRSRRAVELTLGVAFGIAVGDVLVSLIGSGAWQISVVVVIAMVGATLAGGRALLISQSASSAILLVAFGGGGLGPTRMVDALVGGAVGLAVVVVIPRHPVRVAEAALEPVFNGLAKLLDDLADALDRRDAAAARAALDRSQALDKQLATLKNSIEISFETARIAPAWWHTRDAIAADAIAAVHVDRAVRNGRVLARATARAIEVRPELPPEVAAAMRSLAQGARLVRTGITVVGDQPAAVEALLGAAELGARARLADDGLSVAAIVAQVRSMAVDLLRALGTDADDATRRVRRASRRPTPS